ncbi:peptidoglycan DD-metalloendopeptidase family protein [Sneathiella sp.]|uniref:peptidoglycan DD-metalloendopeptidase family protein n=1 Tax=Sneathiella sp. TaxID=1964365 RepID=UPI0039E4304B
MLRPDLRTFPLSKATLAAAVIVGLFTTCLASPAWSASPDEELAKLRKALAVSSERQNEIAGRLQLLSSEITALKRKSVAAANRLTKIDKKLLETETRLADISEVEHQTLQTLSKQNKGLAKTLSALLQLSRQPEGTLIGSPENLINNLRAATLLRSAIPALKKDADLLSVQLETLANLRDQFLSEQQKFAELRKSRRSEQETLTALLDSKSAARAALSGLNAREERQQQKLSLEARDLVALMNRLETEKKARLEQERQRIEADIAAAEEKRRAAKEAASKLFAEQQEEKAKTETDKQAPAVASVPLPVPSHKSGPPPAPEKPIRAEEKKLELAAIGGGQPFSAVKGTLPLPVGGRIISGFRKSGSSSTRNGIVIETRDEAAVISPYDGQIAFAGPFRNYGLLLIIDHGEGYHTLLAGMGSIDGSVGQLLLAGEPVGQMKNDKNGKPTLYMELRVKGSPVNPVPWLTSENRKVSG